MLFSLLSGQNVLSTELSKESGSALIAFTGLRQLNRSFSLC